MAISSRLQLVIASAFLIAVLTSKLRGGARSVSLVKIHMDRGVSFGHLQLFGTLARMVLDESQ